MGTLKLGKTATTRRRLNEPGRRLHPAVFAGLGVAYVAVLVALLYQETTPEDVIPPTLIGEVADDTIVASHPFSVEVVDAEELEAVGDAAEAEILPVWDFDTRMGEDAVERVTQTFESLRAQLHSEARRRLDELPTRAQVEEARTYVEELRAAEEAVRNQEDALDPAADPPVEVEPVEMPTPPENNPALAPDYDLESGVPTQEDFGGSRLLDILDNDARLEVVENAGGLGGLFATNLSAPRRVVAVLAADGFRPRTADALGTLVDGMFTKHIIEDRLELDRIGEGIVLRSITEDETTEREVRRFSDFFELSQVEDLVYSNRYRIDGEVDSEVGSALLSLAVLMGEVNTTENQELTQERRTQAREAAEEEFRSTQLQDFQRGELIVPAGAVITQQDYQVIDHMQSTRPETDGSAWGLVGLIGFIALLIIPVSVYARTELPRFTPRGKELATMATMLVLQLAIVRAGSALASALAAQSDFSSEEGLMLLLPFALGSMVVRILTNSTNALAFTIISSLLCGALFGFDLEIVVYAFLTSLVGARNVGEARTRSEILRSCGVVSLMMTGLSLAFAMIAGASLNMATAEHTLPSVFNGAVVGFFVFSLLPVFEAMFRYTTAIRLMELASLNHPLLKQLVIEAPGTYHHSMMVGQLVEAGCDEIGADSLLGRVGAYFHDIGKMKNPGYFAENQSGNNPHNKLKPNMSALIIKSHVKDGVEMARQHKLPPEIIDFIKEHHGTSLIGYFWSKAREELGESIHEDDFRYPGPKPQSRETAICLLADGIEAASRAMPNKTPAHLKGLVQKMIQKAFADGQLDECELTLKDLNAIAGAFNRRLMAFYHHRPEYPDARRPSTSKTPRAERDADEGSSDEADGAPDPESSNADPGTKAGKPPKSDKAPAAEPAESGSNDDGANRTGNSQPPTESRSEPDDEDPPNLRRLGM